MTEIGERPARIRAYPDGPLIVRGHIEVIDENGHSVAQPRRTVALCRCGASLIKPWCDGSHKLTGFRTSATPAEP
jgi:CDGSH-type Zn-finger protein